MLYAYIVLLSAILYTLIHPSTQETSYLGFVTNPVQTDGFGSQFQSIVAAVVYAELNNKQFVYTPFTAMEHNYTNDPTFLDKKEKFINFIDTFELCTTAHNAEQLDVYKLFFDNNITTCQNSNALKRIKQIFRANKKTDNYFNNNHLNIALHIRRSNAHDCRIEGTNTSDDLFVSLINTLRTLHTTQNPLFHIYSQGAAENFAAYVAPDILLHLNESVEDTFLGMVLADVLITSASSFSHTAALLSNGIIYYIPFWHTPLSHWISVYTLLQQHQF